MSIWREWSNIDPAIRLSEAVTACSMNPDKPLLGMADINGRTGDHIARGSTLARSSLDKVVNTRGRWFLRLCADTSMNILNGTVKEETSPGGFTSFQPLGSTVIDYVFASPGML
ncbi:hypothetical protein B0H17DRAFT_936811, partial [Mycena rosella]